MVDEPRREKPRRKTASVPLAALGPGREYRHNSDGPQAPAIKPCSCDLMSRTLELGVAPNLPLQQVDGTASVLMVTSSLPELV